MKKAQLFQQPIFYIFVLVVAALFLAWGVRSVFQLKERAETVELATSIQDLKNEINTFYSLDYGSNKNINLRLPAKINYICFTNHHPINIPEQLNKYGDLKKIFTITKYNSFIFPQSFQTNAFKIENLKTKQDPLCIQTISSLKATITNIGDAVEITKTI